MNKTQHTEIPYSTAIDGNDKIHIVTNRIEIATMYDKRPKDEQEANARFIVTACNNHDKLVETVKLLWVNYCEGTRLDKQDAENVIRILSQIEKDSK